VTLQAGNCWVDVRDLARAQVLALVTASAGGERIIISAGPWVWQDWRMCFISSDLYFGNDANIRIDSGRGTRLVKIPKGHFWRWKGCGIQDSVRRE
jgi:hypothetical protein